MPKESIESGAILSPKKTGFAVAEAPGHKPRVRRRDDKLQPGPSARATARPGIDRLRGLFGLTRSCDGLGLGVALLFGVRRQPVILLRDPEQAILVLDRVGGDRPRLLRAPAPMIRIDEKICHR
jgi:hypothetical protein